MANLESRSGGGLPAGPAEPVQPAESPGDALTYDGQEPLAAVRVLPRAGDGSGVYLDHAASTPMLPEAFDAMVAELAHTGNPSSLHNAGRRARRVIEESREQIAQTYGARPSEVIFTSGGTEADNLAIKGLFWSRRGPNSPADDEAQTSVGACPAKKLRNRILATATEHHAVLDCVRWLGEHENADVDWLGVDSDGLLSPDTLRDEIERDPDTVALVSVMWANNEVGTIQPIAELASVAARYGIPFHSDAVQAAGQLPVSLAESGATALTITGHKIGGPVGAGALLLARGQDPVPVLHGGGQERDVRSGTLDTAAIAGFAVAVGWAARNQAEHAARVGKLRDSLVDVVRATVPDAILNGPEPGPSRLASNAHFSFPGCEGDALLMLLDAKGIACSTGSACTAGVAQPSHVLLAMGADRARAKSSLRFSLGHTSTQDDIDALGEVIGEVVERARRAGR
ncbi:MAG TPA: cysteine desulfurase family protein [Streptosporangiaceae bacterium]|nr:cysteine desulfurase family protein [Streptosporangiaceae bacterium]